jgi:hypothetical protein
MAKVSKQRINVDFYKVEKNAGGGPTAFKDALKDLIARKGSYRRLVVSGERIDVHHLLQTNNIFEGEFGRLRSHDVPSIATKECDTKDIDLHDDELITERTAFLYDATKNVLAVHVKREGVSPSKIADVCDEIMKNAIKGHYFELLILLTPDAKQRFDSISRFKSFSVKYDSSAQSSIPHPDKTTKHYLDSLNDVNGGQIQITVRNIPRQKDSWLSFPVVRGLLTKAEGAAGVKQLKVTGRDAGDEKLAIDLIEDRMRNSKTIKVVGQSASYEQRRLAVRECYEEKLQYF